MPTHIIGSATIASAALGQFDEAIAEGKRSVELDPLSIVINADLGETLFYARRFDESVAQLRKTLEIDPTSFYAHYNLGIALQAKGDLSGAITEYEKAKQLSGDNPTVATFWAQAKSHAGDKDAARRMLSELDQISQHREVLSYLRALLYLSVNNKDEALRWLEQGYEERDGSNICWINVDPLLDPLHGDPRFEALVQKVIAPNKGAMSNAHNFFTELKRRKVFKVGAAYLIVAWLAVQAASIGFPAFDAPPWALRVFILVALLGFPIGVVMAWVFDITAEGVKLDADTSGTKLSSPQPRCSSCWLWAGISMASRRSAKAM